MYRSFDEPRDDLVHAIKKGCFSILGITIMIALAVDLGHVALVHGKLSRAVGLAADAGAQELSSGQSRAKSAAISVAQSKFEIGYMNTTSRDFRVRVNLSSGSRSVAVHGNAYVPTAFLKYLGLELVAVDASAEAIPE